VAVVLWYARHDNPAWTAVAAAALVVGQIIPYARARADSLGLDGTGGLAGRADRIALVCVGLVLAGLKVPWALEAAVAVTAALGAVTVTQRLARAWRTQGRALPAGSPDPIAARVLRRRRGAPPARPET
ncbi:MAG: hypothetical protein LBI84_04130, partial [Propionibacteriaceae bacterium]|nr:hypothetical protein [Propionibacteriaceae bacterium]